MNNDYIHEQNSGLRTILKNQMWFRHEQQCHIFHSQNTLQKCIFLESLNVIFGPP